MDNRNDFNNANTYFDKTFIIIISCFIITILLYIPNIIFGKTYFLWILSIPLGIIACIFSIRAKKKILIILSFFILFSFSILYYFVGFSEMINHNLSSEERVIVLPEGTKAIREKEIFNYLNYRKCICFE